jgi:ribonuclease T2
MNNKAIIRLVVTLAVAVIGAWQYQAGQPNPTTSPKKQQQNQKQEQTNNQQTGDFDYYLISLSWSPAYCNTHPQDQRQCGGRGFGFVLHGLWPQKSTGGYPQDCPQTSQPSQATVQKTLAFMPSEKLIQHEWTKHGTCTGLTADQYFALADKAYAAVKIPSTFEQPNQSVDLNTAQIVSAFTEANPQLPADSITIRCSKGELEEVRVCVDVELKPKTCGKGVRTQCSKEPVQVRAMR